VVVRRRGIILKSPREIELMRDAGRVVREVLEAVRRVTRPGVTTGELNAVAENLIAQAGGIALFKGQRCPTAKLPFPAALCTSVNEELVHGIPGDRALQEGDIVSVDCGVKLSGYCGDAALTIPVGRVSPEVQTLLDVTRQALELAIAGIRPGRMWSEVARAIQSFVEGHRLAVVREFVGHGIGREMHEEPKVPNYWAREQESFDFALVPNLVIAVEPMVNLGTRLVEIGDDTGWVIVTKDRKYAAHFEHTVAVTEDGVDVLTDGR
jgi:methionyl aminopeptidase